MTKRIKLTESRSGAWLINISKHLSNYDITDFALTSLDTICFAGKCGGLLIKLSADDTEQLLLPRVVAHARLCGINRQELQTYLETLKGFGCIDWDASNKTFEILAHSRERVLTTVSKIFDGLQPSDIEKALPNLLEYCLIRPRLESEVTEFLSRVLPEGDDISHLKDLLRRYELLGIIKIHGKEDSLYFNGYQFGDRAVEIGKALFHLERSKREVLNTLLEETSGRPGILMEDIAVADNIRDFAIGLGLVEVSTVISPAGTAKFLMSPRLTAPSVGKETAHLEDDVFNHAKMLLSSLRFGELRSLSSRGKIVDPSILVNALLERNRVGPCTAIGEDYVVLEGEGVIKTIPARNKAGRQFYMELRRREPAEIVYGLLSSGSSSAIDSRSLPRSLELPLGYKGPETSRPFAARKTAEQDPETIKRFLEALRT